MIWWSQIFYFNYCRVWQKTHFLFRVYCLHSYCEKLAPHLLRCFEFVITFLIWCFMRKTRKLVIVVLNKNSVMWYWESTVLLWLLPTNFNVILSCLCGLNIQRLRNSYWWLRYWIKWTISYNIRFIWWDTSGIRNSYTLSINSMTSFNAKSKPKFIILIFFIKWQACFIYFFVMTRSINF